MSIITKRNKLEVLFLTLKEKNDKTREIQSISSKYRGVMCDINISGGVQSKPMRLPRRSNTLNIIKQI